MKTTAYEAQLPPQKRIPFSTPRIGKMSETKETSSLDSKKETLSRRVHINVGGRIFITTENTLRRSGYFAVLLEDKTFGANPNDPIFIDRDPDAFSQVLNCMRNDGKLLIKPTRNLLNELNYFLVKPYNPYNFDTFMEKYGKMLKDLQEDERKNIEHGLKTCVDVVEGCDIMTFTTGVYKDGEDVKFEMAHYEFECSSKYTAPNLRKFFRLFLSEYVLPSLPYFGWGQSRENRTTTAFRD
jgi:hypothetical protein